MKKISYSLLCGIAAIIITIVLYFIILGNIFLQAIHWITLLGVLIAEAITTGYAYYSKGNPRKVAAAVVSAIMIPVAVYLSVVYIVGFPKGYGTYACWYLVATIIVNIIAIILCSFDSKRNEENEAVQNSKNNMLQMRKIVKCIMCEPAAEQYKDELKSIEDKLHFTNDCIVADQDTMIYNSLIEIQNNIGNQDYDAAATVANIEKLVEQRNIMCKKTV